MPPRKRPAEQDDDPAAKRARNERARRIQLINMMKEMSQRACGARASGDKIKFGDGDCSCGGKIKDFNLELNCLSWSRFDVRKVHGSKVALVMLGFKNSVVEIQTIKDGKVTDSKIMRILNELLDDFILDEIDVLPVIPAAASDRDKLPHGIFLVAAPTEVILLDSDKKK